MSIRFISRINHLLQTARLAWLCPAFILIALLGFNRHIALAAWLCAFFALERAWKQQKQSATEYLGFTVALSTLAAGQSLLSYSAILSALLFAIGLGLGVPLWRQAPWSVILEKTGLAIETGAKAIIDSIKAQFDPVHLDETEEPAEEDWDESIGSPAVSTLPAVKTPEHDRATPTAPAMPIVARRPVVNLLKSASLKSIETTTQNSQAICREELFSHLKSQPATTAAPPLPLIDLPQIKQHLQSDHRVKRHIEQPPPAAPAALPLIASEEIHQRLLHIHGKAPEAAPVTGRSPKTNNNIKSSPRLFQLETKPEPAPRIEPTLNEDPPSAATRPALAKIRIEPSAETTWEPGETITLQPIIESEVIESTISEPFPELPEPRLELPKAKVAAYPVEPITASLEQEPVAGLQPSAPLTWSKPPAPAPLPPAEPVHYSDDFMPTLSLLHPPAPEIETISQDDLLDRGILIEEKLAEFRVKASVLDAYAGPVITRYEIEPAVGVRGAQIVNLMKDMARALGLVSIRVVETIPGKTCMGLELPNPTRQMIRLSEILSSDVYQQNQSKLTIALGKDITGAPIVTDLAKAPHMLVAGTTGSGKSVGVNAMILSLLYKATPEEVRFIMVDPKMLELSVYDGIPHLLAPVVTDMKLAANALNWCVAEMEKRYRLLSTFGVRNLAGFNQKVREAEQRGERLTNPFSLTPDEPEALEHLPFIVVVVDEFADLMMVAGKKIEELIARLAQKARAAGIHLVLATQRPSVDVITGLIKANIPTRLAFQVSSKIDSRTILDQMGAEALLGQGDMLFLPPGSGYPQRIHGAFVDDNEVHRVVEHLKQFGEPRYIDGVLNGGFDAEASASNINNNNEGSESDPLYDEAVALVLKSRRASISAVQRQLRIGYNRAARLIDQMENSGIVSQMESNGNRTVLAPPAMES
ncbi:DNA translocase FtsK [Iodobacter ciconiae]|uniref:Cell division protein FtsK n=1 Tax=Iodobacter ciconiae TaxID=2496266 RepID=A0A3S8ZRW9_9NEIS|nr:DNA translocase FtsK [Iodobacter ciconiae]AZN36260.1 cell division protein FtsK [Iodobacter ciconiae]